MRLPFLFNCVLLLIACQSAVPAARDDRRHLAEKRYPGVGAIYLDTIANHVLLQSSHDGREKSKFVSFRIGLRDSTSNAEAVRKANVYYQYQMQNDWFAIVQADSLRPVFAQSTPQLNRNFIEQVMVFELPKDSNIDTLVYKDSFGPWGVQTFILK